MLALEGKDFASRAISPLRELGAYEALWDKPETTFKVRFHQSLDFTDGGSNRSEEAVRAIREVCRGLVNPAFGAGLDDPACKIR